MSIGVVLFTRDLRLHDNPALWHAVHSHQRGRAGVRARRRDPVRRVQPAQPGRVSRRLPARRGRIAARARGGAGLIIRGGDVVAETAKLAGRVRADPVHVAGDVSGYAQRREQRLTAELACELVIHEDALFAVPPGRIRPSGCAGHVSVSAAYYRS